ncbi:helix-turn-helix domain-containing protein [Undibacterium sp.]|uniref:helix-turn-helix domain-containing protein n=1 Tax=Undibacterium sp. TaxID=1914977 RepID=UPI00375155F2
MKIPHTLASDTEDSTVRIISEMLDVGELVRSKRRQQKLRIDDAAALTEVSVDLFSRLENGKGAVRLDKLLQVLDAMGLCMIVASKKSDLARGVLKSNAIAQEVHSPIEQEASS